LDWRRSSLVRKGVIKLDCGEREGLLIPENIHRGKLEEYARVSAIYSISHGPFQSTPKVVCDRITPVTTSEYSEY
jgi:hypothetical protein